MQEPTDEELLTGFVSNIETSPSSEFGGVDYHGKHMSLSAARQAERADFLRRTRAALKRQREAEAQAAADAAERERARSQFEEAADRGVFRRQLASGVTEYQAKLAQVADSQASSRGRSCETKRASFA
jgi:hypothetical protein